MKVLAIIDMQKDFIDGVLGTKPSSSRAIRIMRSICPHRKAGIFRSRTA